MYYYASPLISFSKSKRNNLFNISDNPGPGHYDRSRSFDLNLISNEISNKITQRLLTSTSRVISKNTSTKTKITKVTQGPGFNLAYNRAHNHSHSNNLSINGVSFSKSQRKINPSGSSFNNTTRISDSVGPGTYKVNSLHRAKSPSYSFSKQPKISLNLNSEFTPGPGAYLSTESNMRRKNMNQTFNKSIRKDIFEIDSNLSLGPGSFNPNNQNNNISYTIPKSQKNLSFQGLSLTPGPSSYEPKINNIKISTSSYSFTKQKKESNLLQSILKNTNPGPGQYEFTDKLKSNDGFTFTKEKISDISLPNPGPADYNVGQAFTKTRGASPSCIIQTTKRDTSFRNKGSDNVPGPGKYLSIVSIKSTVMGKFNTEKKLKDIREISPGPGQYVLPNSIRDFSKEIYDKQRQIKKYIFSVK